MFIIVVEGFLLLLSPSFVWVYL